MVTRVAYSHPLILVSELSTHTKALRANPACSLLLGEPGVRGDPLTHPRITLHARAEPARKSDHRDQWLSTHPKARLYFDFADFILFELIPTGADLNGGFGKAFRLTPDDLR